MSRQKSVFRLILEPIALAILLALAVRATFFHIYAIPSASMEPTLRAGDHILVTPYRFPFSESRPERGDVVVFRSPVSADLVVVKRVVGTPGDLIEVRAGRIVIGGHTVVEPYVREQAASSSVAPQMVPRDCYFVMGDNRPNSYDSRNWGPCHPIWSSAPPG